MSILIKIEEFFRNRKLNNQKKIFITVQNILRKIDADNRNSDNLVMSLAMACDYKTLYFTLNRILIAVNHGIKTEKNPEALKYYRKCQSFFGFLKFVLDFHGGYLGALWL